VVKLFQKTLRSCVQSRFEGGRFETISRMTRKITNRKIVASAARARWARRIRRRHGLAMAGAPSTGMQLALGMELLVTPGLFWWQGRVARVAAFR